MRCRWRGGAPASARAHPGGGGPRRHAAPAGRAARLCCECAAAPDGGMPSSRLSPMERIKRAILGGYLPADEAATPSTSGKDAAPNAAGSGAGLQPGHTAGSSPPGIAAAATAEPLDPGSWEWWNQYFDFMDDSVRELDGVDDEMEEAVASEDYRRAAELRVLQKRLEDMDPVGGVLDQLQAALDEERYSDAAALRDNGGAGLLGWWVGRGKADDVQGHLIRVTPDFGRYVAHAYTGANVAELTGWSNDAYSKRDVMFLPSSPEQPEGPVDNGSAVFELFLRRQPTADGGGAESGVRGGTGSLMQQAAALHAPYDSVASAAVMDDLSQLLSSEAGKGGGATMTVERGRNEDGVGYVRINLTSAAGPDKNSDDEDSDDDIRTIDDLAASARADDSEDEDSSTDEDIAAGDDGDGGSRAEAGAVGQAEVSGPGVVDFEGEAVIEINGQVERLQLSRLLGLDGGGADVADTSGSGGGDTLSAMGLGLMAHRVPAEIEWHGRDAFTLNVPQEDSQPDLDDATAAAEAKGEGAGASDVCVEVTSTLTEGEAVEVLVLPPGGGASKAGRSVGGGGVADMEKAVRRAMGEAIAQGIGAVGAGTDCGVLGLEGRVRYTRLPPNDAPTDTFSGVYLGTFGPHGPELLQVSRVVVDGEEWVHGTKLTGDQNVPAGKVSFRARVGKAARLAPSAAYPPELGVRHRYKGQGRVARDGYSNAKWVEGELLTFAGSSPVSDGAELGFVYNLGSDSRFLLLFTKVNLDSMLP